MAKSTNNSKKSKNAKKSVDKVTHKCYHIVTKQTKSKGDVTMSEKSKQNVEKIAQLVEEFPSDKRALAVKMAEIYATGLADGVELVTMRTERKDADATNPKAV